MFVNLFALRERILFPPRLQGRGIARPRGQAIALEGKIDFDSVS